MYFCFHCLLSLLNVQKNKSFNTDNKQRNVGRKRVKLVRKDMHPCQGPLVCWAAAKQFVGPRQTQSRQVRYGASETRRNLRKSVTHTRGA